MRLQVTMRSRDQQRQTQVLKEELKRFKTAEVLRRPPMDAREYDRREQEPAMWEGAKAAPIEGRLARGLNLLRWAKPWGRAPYHFHDVTIARRLRPCRDRACLLAASSTATTSEPVEEEK